MANILAVGVLVGRRRSACGTFILGFAVFGALALAFFVFLASCFRGERVDPYPDLALRPVFEIIGLERPRTYLLVAGLVAAGVLGLPQLAFALTGGFLSRRHKVAVTRR